MVHNQSQVYCTRRRFLAGGGVFAAACLAPQFLARSDEAAPESDDELKLFFVGQSLIEHTPLLEHYAGYQSICESLRDADLRFTNLEVSIQTPESGLPTKDDMFFHAARPEVLETLQEYGFELLSLANNHAFDLGTNGILATAAEVGRRGFTHAGTGRNLAEATAPALRSTPQGSVALIAMASNVDARSIADKDQPGLNHLAVRNGKLKDQDAKRNLMAIESAAKEGHFVIVYQHDHYWEKDRQRTPEWKRAWAAECIDAGANVFVSHGIPMLHGMEIYKKRPIFYGLGNFIFHTRTPPQHYTHVAWESLIAGCTFRHGNLSSLTLRPIRLTDGVSGDLFLRTRGWPQLIDQGNPQADQILKRFADLSRPFGMVMRVKEGEAHVLL
ncbi:CapA family protein [Planctomicrobium sp. SH661]|uniref:CapA family protein n=1 Tax=Planctomicrobium sp. SH661 TaxID=3448124 RepID=UPI003F5AEECB